jgi:hypothetical protein
MFHKHCSLCIHPCKQEETVTIVHCPKYQKRVTDDEFRDLVEELKHTESEADALKKRIHELLTTAHTPNDTATPETNTMSGTEANSKESNLPSQS